MLVENTRSGTFSPVSRCTRNRCLLCRQQAIHEVCYHQDVKRIPYHTPRPASYYKGQGTEELEEVPIPQTLKGKTVLIIGMEPKKADYRDRIEERGGEMIWSSGNEELERLDGMINKADVVVIMKLYMSHRGSKQTVKLCKELDVPFGVADTLGNETIINTVETTIIQHQLKVSRR